MDFELYKQEIFYLSESLGFTMDKLVGIDCFMPFFQKIKEDSSILIIKLDGERKDNIFTLLISGNILGENNYIRTETSDLEGGLSFIIIEYAKKAWK
ncbi:hypothetical protein [Paenibacillus shenyangensis]|uniref:hypothetical protein n=1 Tax=Paenibacillus sp. A9 TaxID=1284352 RepID=UPI000369CE04|nr:hypothetical protein [Paenibacillus sp. A9]